MDASDEQTSMRSTPTPSLSLQIWQWSVTAVAWKSYMSSACAIAVRFNWRLIAIGFVKSVIPLMAASILRTQKSKRIKQQPVFPSLSGMYYPIQRQETKALKELFNNSLRSFQAVNDLLLKIADHSKSLKFSELRRVERNVKYFTNNLQPWMKPKRTLDS
jgi:hypothetical protein